MNHIFIVYYNIDYLLSVCYIKLTSLLVPYLNECVAEGYKNCLGCHCYKLLLFVSNFNEYFARAIRIVWDVSICKQHCVQTIYKLQWSDWPRKFMFCIRSSGINYIIDFDLQLILEIGFKVWKSGGSVRLNCPVWLVIQSVWPLFAILWWISKLMLKVTTIICITGNVFLLICSSREITCI